MAQTPYAYDNNQPAVQGRGRFYLGLALLLGSLVLIGVVLWQLQVKKEGMPEETGVPARLPVPSPVPTPTPGPASGR